MSKLKEPRKVYIWGNLSQNEMNETYHFLDLKYIRTNSEDEADFLIVDLNKPPDELQEDLFDMTPKTFSCRPVVFVSLKRGNENNLNSDRQDETGAEKLLSWFKQTFRFEVTVCKGEEELKNTLDWYSFMFRRPYWEKEDLDRMAIMALMKSRNGETLG